MGLITHKNTSCTEVLRMWLWPQCLGCDFLYATFQLHEPWQWSWQEHEAGASALELAREWQLLGQSCRNTASPSWALKRTQLCCPGFRAAVSNPGFCRLNAPKASIVCGPTHATCNVKGLSNVKSLPQFSDICILGGVCLRGPLTRETQLQGPPGPAFLMWEAWPGAGCEMRKCVLCGALHDIRSGHNSWMGRKGSRAEVRWPLAEQVNQYAEGH